MKYRNYLMTGRHAYLTVFGDKSTVRQKVEGNSCLCTSMRIFMYEKHIYV